MPRFDVGAAVSAGGAVLTTLCHSADEYSTTTNRRAHTGARLMGSYCGANVGGDPPPSPCQRRGKERRPGHFPPPSLHTMLPFPPRSGRRLEAFAVHVQGLAPRSAALLATTIDGDGAVGAEARTSFAVP